MSPSKQQLETQYGVPVFVKWDDVPAGLYTRTQLLKQFNYVLPLDAKPAAIKGGGLSHSFYFLYAYKKTEGYNDDTPMPFGVHKDKPLSEVPDRYFLTLYDNSKNLKNTNPQLYAYILDNLDAFQANVKREKGEQKRLF